MSNDPKPTAASYGQAMAGQSDPKSVRVRHTPAPFPVKHTHSMGEGHFRRVCKHCKRWGNHAITCPSISVGDAVVEVQGAVRREQLARDQAYTWLTQVRLMHGKLAAMKQEIKTLRKRLAEAEKKHGPG